MIVGFLITRDGCFESLLIFLFDDFSGFEVRMSGKEILLIGAVLISHCKYNKRKLT